MKHYDAVYTVTGKFVCWYDSPEGQELEKNISSCNNTYHIVEVREDNIAAWNLPRPPGEQKMNEGKKQPAPSYVIQSLAMALRRVYDHMHYRAPEADRQFLDEHALEILKKFTPQFAPQVFEPFTMVVSTLDEQFICWYSPHIENAMVQAQAAYKIRLATAEEKENFA